MIITCETCKSAEATVLCLPGNNAACSACGAKQRSSAGKQVQKVALSAPAEPRMCDICQDAPAYCMCVDERAILCRECDLSIHKSNKFMEGHCRYLFPGITLGLEDLSGTKAEPAAAAAAAAPSRSKRKATSQLANNGKQPAMMASQQSMQMMPPPNGGASSSMQMGMGFPGSSMEHNMAQNSAMYMPQPNQQQPMEGSFFSSAAEFLGVPGVSENFTIKDVDAAYMADEFGSYAPLAVPEDVSHLLEVPDLDFSEFQGEGGGGDAVVPDIY